MIDRFGKMPQEFENLLKTIELKILAKHLGIIRIEAGNTGAVLEFNPKLIENFDMLMQKIMQNIFLKILPDNKISIIAGNFNDIDARFEKIKSVLEKLL
jgi:transcription-repair coupling factor (superfamily II helicase)